LLTNYVFCGGFAASACAFKTKDRKGDLWNMGGKKKESKEKPLEKMTAKELREVGKQIPEITGVYGMNKAELVSAIKKARGITEDLTKKNDSSVREIKKKIKALKAVREATLNENDHKMAEIYRRRIKKLKKKTRRAA
jgi:protein-arginine kinase activator protein McsA